MLGARRQLTIDEHVQADAQCPDVGLLPQVGVPSAHFRGKKGRGAHGAHCGVSMVHHAGTAKVTDLDTAIRGQQHVVWLEIAVYNVLGVQVVQALQVMKQHPGRAKSLVKDKMDLDC